jgi:hypothetical protein
MYSPIYPFRHYPVNTEMNLRVSHKAVIFLFDYLRYF